MKSFTNYLKDPFKLKENGATISKEIIGGLTTFLAISYILAVNPSMLGSIGAGTENAMGFGPVFTATALSALVATLVMGFFANLPVALASGMGLNAFFAFTVCGQMGLSWQYALTAILLEGIIFILLSFFGVREAIIKSIPVSLRKAVSVGIGMFIALIGLTNAGITSNQTGTIIGFVNFNQPAALVCIIGLIITIVLYIMKVPGSILIAIVASTIIGIPFGITTVPENFSPVALPQGAHWFSFDFGATVLDAAGKFSFTVLGQFIVVIFTFLFTDMFDTIGTLMGVADQAKLVDEKGNIKNVKQALLADAVGTVFGACCGTSTVTSYVESTTGVAAGAKTGLASIVTAIMFFVALFFGPCFAIIPGAATAPALIFVGFLMMTSIKDINFSDITESIPAALTIMVMPFSYSIAKGIAFGMISYVLCKCAARKFKEIPIVTWVVAIIFICNLIFEAVK